MIRSSTRIDRRRKQAPAWEPPSREPSVSQRIGNALRLADSLKRATSKESTNAR